MITDQRVLLIVPAYNEEASIQSVIEGIGKELSHADILVVDDGSTDRTSERAERSGAVVLSLPFNCSNSAASCSCSLSPSSDSLSTVAPSTTGSISR